MVFISSSSSNSTESPLPIVPRSDGESQCTIPSAENSTHRVRSYGGGRRVEAKPGCRTRATRFLPPPPRWATKKTRPIRPLANGRAWVEKRPRSGIRFVLQTSPRLAFPLRSPLCNGMSDGGHAKRRTPAITNPRTLPAGQVRDLLVDRRDIFVENSSSTL